MSITYVGGSYSTTSTGPNLPAGWQAGDVAICWAYGGSDPNDAGWSYIRTIVSGMSVGYRVLRAGDTKFSDFGNSGIGGVVYRGVDTSSPFEWWSGWTWVSGATLTLPAYTAARATTLPIILVQGYWSGGHQTTGGEDVSGTGLTNRSSGWTPTTYQLGIAEANSTGSYAGGTFTTTNAPTNYAFVSTIGLREAGGGYPVVADADTTSGTVTSNSSSWTLTYPTSIAAGDLLIAAVVTDGNSATGAFPAGWVKASQYAAGTAAYIHINKKLADGSESGTFTFSVGASEQGAWIIYRIPAGTWEGTLGTIFDNIDSRAGSVSIATGSGASLNPNPPSLNPYNWATENTLWLAFAAVDTSRTFSGYPSGMTNTGSMVSGGSTGASLGFARLESAVASYDPGTFTISNSDDWAVATIAIRPKPATQTLEPGLLDGSSALYAPTVAGSGPSAQGLTLGLLNGSSAIYAPTVLPQPVTLDPGLLTSVSALYAPTSVKPTNAVGALDQLASVPTAYAPTIAPGPVAAALGLLDGSKAIYSLSVPPQSVTVGALGLLDGAAGLYAPTLLPQPVSLGALGLLDGSAVLYEPALLPQPVSLGALDLLDGVADQFAPALGLSLATALLDGEASPFEPAVLPQPVTIAGLALLDGGAALYGPTAASQAVTVGNLDLLESASSLYSPVAKPLTSFVAPLLDGAGALYAPTASPVNGLEAVSLLDGSADQYGPSLKAVNLLGSLDLLDSGPALYGLAVLPAQFVEPSLVDGQASLHAPTILPQPVTVGPLGQIEVVAELYDPTATAQPVGVSLDLLASSSGLYAPEVQPAQFIETGLLDGAGVLYAPTLLPQPITLQPALLDGVAGQYTPTLVPAPIGASLSLLESSPALYGPTLLPQPVTIGALALLDGGAGLFAPSVQPAQYLSVDCLESSPALYGPTLLPQPIAVSVDLLDGVADLYGPQVQPDQTLAATLLDGGAVLYAPSVGAGTVGVDLDLLDGACALYAPQVQPAQYLELGLLESTSTVYAPTATAGPVGVGALALLDGGAGQYDPSLSLTLALAALDGGAGLYDLAAAVGPVSVVLPLLDGEADLYFPEVTGVGGASRTLITPLLDGGASVLGLAVAGLYFVGPLDPASSNPALFGLTLGPINQTDLGALGEAPVVYAPAVAAGSITAGPLGFLESAPASFTVVLAPQPVTTDLSFVDSTAILFSPTVGPKGTITLAALDGGRSQFALALGVGPVTLGPLDDLDGLSAIYSPEIERGIAPQALEPSLLDGAVGLYGPTVSAKASLTIGTIGGAPVLFGLTIQPGPISAGPLGSLGGPAALYDLALAPLNPFALTILDGGRGLYDPTLLPQSVSVVIPLADGHAQVYQVVVKGLELGLPKGVTATVVVRAQGYALLSVAAKDGAIIVVREKRLQADLELRTKFDGAQATLSVHPKNEAEIS